MLLVIVLLLVLIGAAYWYFVMNKPNMEVNVSPFSDRIELRVPSVKEDVYTIFTKKGAEFPMVMKGPPDDISFGGLDGSTEHIYSIISGDLKKILAHGSVMTLAAPPTVPESPAMPA